VTVTDSTDYNYVTPNAEEGNDGNEYVKLDRENRLPPSEYQRPTRNEEDEAQEPYVGPEPQPRYVEVQGDSSDTQYVDVRGNDTGELPQYLDVVSHEEELYSDVSDTVERTPQLQDSEELEIYVN